MRYRDPRKNDEPPPIYDPNGNLFTLVIHTRGKLEQGSYVGGNISKFDLVNGNILGIQTLKDFGKNCQAGSKDVTSMYSCVEGRFEEVTDDKSFKKLVQDTIKGDRVLDLYFVLIEVESDGEGDTTWGCGIESGSEDGEGLGDELEGFEAINGEEAEKEVVDSGCEYNSDSEGEDYREEEYSEEEEEGLSDYLVEDESVGEEGSEDEEVVNFSGDENVNESGEDFASDKGSDDEIGGERLPIFNTKDMFNPKLSLKMIFSNKWELIEAIHGDAIIKKRDIQLTKNDRERVYAECKGKDCKWGVKAYIIPNEPSFQITSYNSTHTCPQSYHIKSMRSSWLTGRYGYQFKTDPKKKVASFKQDLMFELGVNITNHQAYKAKKMALEDQTGNGDFQYKLVWDFAEEIRRSNPNSTVVIDVDQQPTGPILFDKMYMCLNALKSGFLAGCRRLVGVDGCHLKGPHGGILLAAVGVDGNNNIFPIAWAVVGKETVQTWDWFLTFLKSDLQIQGNAMKTWTFISDKQKGLVKAMQSVFPTAAHRFCVRHLHGNIVNAGFRGNAFKIAIYKAAKATTKNEFKRRLFEINQLSPMLAHWLDDKPPEQWCKAYFTLDAHCDIILNNICESFNAAILPAREMPIISMLEWIVDYCRERLRKHREWGKKGRKWKGKLCPKIQNLVNQNVSLVGNCQPMKADDWHYQIREIDGTQFAVDLALRTCGCGRWQLTGLPCLHATRAIYCQQLRPEDFVHEAYYVSTYHKAYQFAVMPLNGRDEWEPTGIVPPLPPNIGRQAGRPPKARRVEPGEQPLKKKKRTRGREPKNPNKLKRRIFAPPKCSRCHQVGHNIRGCKTPMQEIPSTSGHANIPEPERVMNDFNTEGLDQHEHHINENQTVGDEVNQNEHEFGENQSVGDGMNQNADEISEQQSVGDEMNHNEAEFAENQTVGDELNQDLDEIGEDQIVDDEMDQNEAEFTENQHEEVINEPQSNVGAMEVNEPIMQNAGEVANNTAEVVLDSHIPSEAGDEMNLNLGIGDYLSQLSQVIDEVPVDFAIRSCMNTYQVNAMLKDKSRFKTVKNNQETRHAACTGNVPTRAPPSVREQLTGNKPAPNEESVFLKDGVRFVTLSRLKKFSGRKKY